MRGLLSNPARLAMSRATRQALQRNADLAEELARLLSEARRHQNAAAPKPRKKPQIRLIR